MKELKLLSWNVNGIRAIIKKGFSEWLYKENPDILCLQETKASPEQLPGEVLEPDGYIAYWNYPEEVKGYSGVAIFTRDKPVNVTYGINNKEFDKEGRVIVAEYRDFTLCNVYFPKGDTRPAREHRLKYKLDFYNAFLHFLDKHKSSDVKMIICGDFNTAHREIDLARPKENAKNSGFLPEERAWIDKIIAHGFIDTFRLYHQEPNQYSWWDMKTKARERNIGWRIDYFIVSENARKSVSESFIMPEVKGSDHCPIGITLKMQ
jgi:exodeoxyribonuclease-3